MRQFLALILISLLAPVVSAEWGYVDEIDAFTDETVKYTFHRDDEHTIQIRHLGEGDLWVFIERKKLGSIERDSIIESRVDDNEPIEFDLDVLGRIGELAGEPWVIWEPNMVGFVIQKVYSPGGCARLIDELADGKVFRVRYRISSLEQETFSVDLTGARDAINSGLDANC